MHEMLLLFEIGHGPATTTWFLANIITGREREKGGEEFVNSFPNSFVFCPTLIFISEIRVPGVF